MDDIKNKVMYDIKVFYDGTYEIDGKHLKAIVGTFSHFCTDCPFFSHNPCPCGMLKNLVNYKVVEI